MLSSWNRCYWLGGAMLGIFLIVAVVMNSWLPSEKQVDRRIMGLDFVAFYTAGTFARQGKATELYDLGAIGNFQKKLAVENNLKLKSTAAWWNPPVFAWTLAPLSKMNFRSAYWTWLAFNALCLAAAIGLLVKLFPPGTSWKYRALIPLLICVSMPTVQAFGHAQNSAISLLIVAGGLTLAMKNRPVLGGAILGLLGYKPQIALAIAIIFALSINWRICIGFVGVAVGLIAVNFFALPGSLQQYALHLGENLHAVQFGQTYIWERQVTLGGFWRLLLQGREPASRSNAVVLLTLLSQAVMAMALFAGWRRSRESHDATARESFLISGMIAMPLLLPYFLDYDLLLLAVPMVLYARRNLAALRLTPSPGTPREGRGGGVFEIRNTKSETRSGPRPNPPPEYQVREKDSAFSLDKNPPRMGTMLWTALYLCLLINPGIGRLTHVNLAVPLLCATVVAMMVPFMLKKASALDEMAAVKDFHRMAA